MRPATVDPYPRERWRAKNDRTYVAQLHPAQLRAIVTEVVTDLYPKRRSAGVLAMLIWLTVAALSTGVGVHVGHAELAQRFGVGRSTVTLRLGEWRAARNLDRKRRGRKGAGVTWFTVPPEVVKAVAALARSRKPPRDGKRHKASQLQRPKLPQVAALRAAGTGGAASRGRPAAGPAGPTDAQAQRLRIAALLYGSDDDCEHGSPPGRCPSCRLTIAN